MGLEGAEKSLVNLGVFLGKKLSNQGKEGQGSAPKSQRFFAIFAIARPIAESRKSFGNHLVLPCFFFFLKKARRKTT